MISLSPPLNEYFTFADKKMEIRRVAQWKSKMVKSKSNLSSSRSTNGNKRERDTETDRERERESLQLLDFLATPIDSARHCSYAGITCFSSPPP